jgi:hypothetical protein
MVILIVGINVCNFADSLPIKISLLITSPQVIFERLLVSLGGLRVKHHGLEDSPHLKMAFRGQFRAIVKSYNLEISLYTLFEVSQEKISPCQLK